MTAVDGSGKTHKAAHRRRADRCGFLESQGRPRRPGGAGRESRPAPTTPPPGMGACDAAMLDCVQLCHGARPAVVVDGEAAAGERVYLAGSGSADPVVSARAAAALAACWVEGLSVQSVPERRRPFLPSAQGGLAGAGKNLTSPGCELRFPPRASGKRHLVQVRASRAIRAWSLAKQQWPAHCWLRFEGSRHLLRLSHRQQAGRARGTTLHRPPRRSRE